MKSGSVIERQGASARSACPRKTWLAAGLAALLSLNCALPMALAAEPGPILSNGFTPVLERNFTFSLLSSDMLDHKTLRSADKLVRELRDVLAKAESLGVELKEPVHVRIWTDLEFPALDIWKSYGTVPNEPFFKSLQERIELSYAVTTIEELIAENIRNLRDFPFLAHVPIPYEISQRGIDDLRGRAIDEGLEEAARYISGLRAGLDKPLADSGRFYYIARTSCYEPQNNVVWVHWKGGNHALHRDWDIIVHEVGHHVFMQLVKQKLRENGRSEGATPLSLGMLVEPILALNEFFADFTAVANGDLMNIDLHHYEDLPDESKRYFSRKRTLEEFIEAAGQGGDRAYFLSEAHNVLNPGRYFVWRLKQDLDSETMVRLVFAAVADWVTEYLVKDIDRYERRYLRVEPGCFAVLGYPKDIKSLNLRLLHYLRAEAARMLDHDELAVFERAAREVYGRWAAGP